MRLSIVMAGHSRPKDGVALLAYVPAIHGLRAYPKNVDARDKPGHDNYGWREASRQKHLTSASACARLRSFTAEFACSDVRNWTPRLPRTWDMLSAVSAVT